MAILYHVLVGTQQCPNGMFKFLIFSWRAAFLFPFPTTTSATSVPSAYQDPIPQPTPPTSMTHQFAFQGFPGNILPFCQGHRCLALSPVEEILLFFHSVQPSLSSTGQHFLPPAWWHLTLTNRNTLSFLYLKTFPPEICRAWLWIG